MLRESNSREMIVRFIQGDAGDVEKVFDDDTSNQRTNDRCERTRIVFRRIGVHLCMTVRTMLQ